MATYYKASGKFSINSFLFFILTSLVILPILSLLYTYLIWYIPFIYLNVLITLGFGFGIAIAINFFVIKLGKVRNSILAMLFGTLAAVFASYYSWVIWVDLVINAGESYGSSRIGITASNIQINQVLDLALHPKELFNLIAEINEFGTWGIGSSTVSGMFLTLIWAIEFLIIFILSILLPAANAKIPFCESEEKWYKELNLPGFNFIEDISMLTSNLESQSPTSFDELKTVKDQEKESHSLFTLFYSDKGVSYLSLENKTSTINKKGEVEFNNETIVEYISISELMKDKLQEVK